MHSAVKENYKISGFLVFFLIHSTQTGIGMLSFQRQIIEGAGQDSWIAVIIAGLCLHIVLWMMVKILNNPSKDIIDIHRYCFGMFLGNAVSLLLIGYFFIIALTVLLAYINILQVWIFPALKTWELSLVLLIILYYLITGGFRVLTGFCFFSVLLSTGLMFSLYFPFQHGQLNYLFPIFNHSFSDLLKSSQSSSIVFLGFESLLLYFPYLKSPQTNIKWAHFALLFSTIKYLALLIVTLLYFSQGHLSRTLWPTLEMMKIIEVPFLERFEYLFIFIWLMIIIPTICIPLWCCTRITKRLFALKPKLFLVVVLAFLFIAAQPFNDQTKIYALSRFTSQIGIYFVIAYIPLLFVLYFVIKKMKGKRLAL